MQEKGTFRAAGFRRGRRACVAAVVCICFFLFGCSKKGEEIVLAPLEAAGPEEGAAGMPFHEAAADAGQTAPAAGGAEVAAETLPAQIYVHVCGSVMSEGVYELPEKSRVFDAVAAAGGFREDADTAYVNQAAFLSDGLQIAIPTREEAEAAREDGGRPQIFTEGLTGGAAEEAADGRVNLNTASKEALCTIPGIGASRAQDIIDYREAHGRFERIEDIMNVSGIKEKLFEKIKDTITV